MTVTRRRDADSHADEVLPLDGPYDPEAMSVAVGVIGELVRHLNHATMWQHADQSLTYPSGVDQLVGGLSRAVAGLPQMLQQLAIRLETFADDPRLGFDRMGQPLDPPEAASVAAEYLRHAARGLGQVGTDLAMARSCTGRLTLQDDGEDD